jgi:hypothetical protein
MQELQIAAWLTTHDLALATFPVDDTVRPKDFHAARESEAKGKWEKKRCQRSALKIPYPASLAACLHGAAGWAEPACTAHADGRL